MTSNKSKSLQIAEVYFKHHEICIEDQQNGTTFCIWESSNAGFTTTDPYYDWTCSSDCAAYDLCCKLLGNRDGPVLSTDDVLELSKTYAEYFI